MVLHSGPLEHLRKLRRIVARLGSQEMHVDDLDDFCKTAWHLVELVEKNPDSTRDMKRRASRLRADPDIVLCQYVATVEKHAESKPEVAARAGLRTVSVRQGWGVGRFGKGAWGVGEQSVTFELEDGTERNAIAFAAAVLRKWEAVFEGDAASQPLQGARGGAGAP